ncbi:MAG: HlyD family efflux transporter periplasmic adaptor subunit [Planctomycetes bacterium]|nr:HlyD family efflux transporter periplasmic adaptor subunit [Planctomycetota bacterium]
MSASGTGGSRRAATLITLAIMIAVIAAVSLGAYAMIGSRTGGGAGYATADLVPVQRMDFDITTTAMGELAAAQQLEIRSMLESESTIIEVVDEGITVKKGDLLVRLNSDRIQTAIEEDELRVESARSEVVAAENAVLIQESRNASSLRDATLQVTLKSLALEQWLKGDDKKELLRIRLRIDSAKSELKRLRRELEKDIQLNQQDFLSDNDLAKSELAVVKAEAESETAHLEREIYKGYIRLREEKIKQSDVVQAEAKLLEVEIQNDIELVSKEAKRSNERSQFQRREARLARLRAELEATTIVAPSDGLVVFGTSLQRNRRWGNSGEGPLQIGRRVYPNMLLIVLPDTAEMVATVRVHESLVGQIRPGYKATVKIDATGGETFTGTIIDIGVLAEGGGWMDPNRREYTVRIALDVDGESAKLKPSMRCEAKIFIDHVADALAIPLPALFSEGSLRYVYVRQSGKFVRRPVKISRRSDNYVEILEGLAEGDRVLVREPSPSEVIQRDWDQQELAAVGFTLDEDGKAVSMQPRTARGSGFSRGSPSGGGSGGPTEGLQGGEGRDHGSARRGRGTQ